MLDSVLAVYWYCKWLSIIHRLNTCHQSSCSAFFVFYWSFSGPRIVFSNTFSNRKRVCWTWDVTTQSFVTAAKFVQFTSTDLSLNLCTYITAITSISQFSTVAPCLFLTVVNCTWFALQNCPLICTTLKIICTC